MERKVGKRNMERICRGEQHGKEMQERGSWKGYVGERKMERICRREEHGKEGRKEKHGKEGMREEHEEGAQRQSHNKKLKQKPSLLNLFTHH